MTKNFKTKCITTTNTGRAAHELIATLARLDLPDRLIALRAACEYLGIECGLGDDLTTQREAK